MNKPVTLIQRNIPEELRRQLNIQAAKEGRKQQEVVRDAIVNYLTFHEEEGRK